MPCPYADLYIYHIEGRIDPRARIEDRSFLGHWQEADSAFLFFSAPAAGIVAGLLDRRPELRLIDHTRMRYEDWQSGVLAGERIGRFVFRPPWQEVPDPDGAGDGAALTVRLDPGLVFGTGAHPTTRDCLGALELAAQARAVTTALDLGTGSGILALAAALLGARVLAVDLNPLAARTALRNVRLNGLERRVLVVQGRAETAADCPAELGMANLHGGAMLAVMERPGFRRKARWILSGLMRSDAREVRRRLPLLGFRVVEAWERDGVWHTYFAEAAGGAGRGHFEPTGIP